MVAEFCHLFAGELAGADVLGGGARCSRDSSIGVGGAWVFKREDVDAVALGAGCVGTAEGEGGFAHGGAPGQDGDDAALQAAELAVELVDAGGYPGCDGLTALHGLGDFVELVHSFAHDLADGEGVARLADVDNGEGFECGVE